MKVEFDAYTGPAGGWGSVGSLAARVSREGNPISAGVTLMYQNKPRGFACASCAWAKPAKPHAVRILRERREGHDLGDHAPARHAGLLRRHTLQRTGVVGRSRVGSGRPPDPSAALRRRERPATCRCHGRMLSPRSARELRGFDAEAAVFYTSGRAVARSLVHVPALGAPVWQQQPARQLEHVPRDAHRWRCRESIGVPVGTVTLDDFATRRCFFFFGQNVGSNSPRMLHDLQEARRRGVPIVTFNPLRERGLEAFTNPQNPGRDAQRRADHHQFAIPPGEVRRRHGRHHGHLQVTLRAGTMRARRCARAGLGFHRQHTHGFEEFADAVRAADWAALERRSGLTRNAMEAAAPVYARAKAVIGIYGMGLTQHVKGVRTVQMVANLLLLRGNIGRPGAGICPVRGHSNVQGQRTVGITEKPELVPLDRLAKQFGFEPPRDKGLNTVDACEAMLAGKVNAFIGLGGNFVRAVPERERDGGGVAASAADRADLDQTQSQPCRARRSSLHPAMPWPHRTRSSRRAGRRPCRWKTAPAASMARLAGVRRPARTCCPNRRSSPESPRRRLSRNPRVDWDGWVANYDRVREAIGATWPDIFHDMNHRMWEPGGFHRPLAARERKWNTDTGRANFITPETLTTDIDTPREQRDVVQLITLRSNDQFNTTVYGYDDRFRGIHGTRMVVLMHRNDMARFGLNERDMVTLSTAVDDGRQRTVSGLMVVPYNIPEGNIAAYYPECNPLLPLWHHAEGSLTPAAKSIPVRVLSNGSGAGAPPYSR